MINGNNHEIDAKNKNRIFNIEGSNIIINNLVLKNGINQALFITGKNITTNNVTFINCNSGPDFEEGGAIYAFNATYVSNDDKFIDNYATNKGAGIYSRYSNITVNNGLFKNDGIYWSSIFAMDSYLTVTNTTFANSTSKYATAIYTSDSIVNIKKSKFVNLVADITAGALAFKEANYVVIE